MPRVQIGMIGSVLLAIVLYGMVPRVAYAVASCSVSASGSLTPSSAGSVSLRVTNGGDTPLEWVYVYKSDTASPFTGGSADGWSMASSDESRMEFTGGSIGPSAATSYSLDITAGAESGSLGFDVQASESPDGSNRIECGSTSVEIAAAPSVSISSIVVSEVTSSSVKVSWTSDSAADTYVYYGTTTNYGSTKSDGARVTSHGITITDLSANTTYHYYVKSTTEGNISGQSGDNSFVTAKAGSTGATQTGTTSTVLATPTPTPIPDRSGPTIRVTTDISKPFTTAPVIEGKISDGSGVTSVTYSFDGGKNYIPVDTLVGTSAKTFTFRPQVTLDDDYPIVIRGVDGAGNTATKAIGTLTIDRMPPRVGAVLISLGSIVIDEKHGRIPLIAGIPYRITLSAVGGPISMRVNVHGQADETTLTKNTDTGLWEGLLTLTDPRDATLSISARDGAGNVVTSDVATLHGIVSGVVSDGQSPMSDVRVRVFVKNSKSTFVPWDWAEYGEVLLGKTDKEGEYAIMLPKGTYYIEYEKDGYETVRTRIFTFETPSVVSSNVHMRLRRGFWIAGKWFFPLFGTTTHIVDIQTESEDAKGDSASAIHVGEALPYVPFVYNGSPISYLSLRGKPTLITFLTSWSPTAIAQLRVINRMATNTNINVMGIFSQETDSSVAVMAKRGLYRVALVADPDGIAAEAVSVHSVPLHIMVDRTGVVRHIYTGFMTEEALRDALIR